MKLTKRVTILCAALATAVPLSLLVSSCISPESASAPQVVSKTSSAEHNEDTQHDGEGEESYRLSVLDIDSLQIIHTHVLFDQKILTTDDGFASEPYSGVPSSPRFFSPLPHVNHNTPKDTP